MAELKTSKYDQRAIDTARLDYKFLPFHFIVSKIFPAKKKSRHMRHHILGRYCHLYASR